MADVRIAHTAQLSRAHLGAARALLDDVFAGEMTELDWEHALGGMHALAWDGSELIGHAAVIQRRLLHGGRALRAGYVEGVAVRADRRRRGVGGALLGALEPIVHRAFDLGGLGATDAAVALYRSRGWQRWEGPTAMLTPNGIVRTEEEDGSVYVLPVAVPLDLSGQLTCDWRDGDAW